jgi:hypothetical protein
MFKQVPFIAIQILEYGYNAVSFPPGFFEEPNSLSGHSLIIPKKIVCVKKKENPPPGLFSDLL